MSIKGAEGLSSAELQQILGQGGRLIYFRYVISVFVITFQRGATVLVRPGQSTFLAGLPYTLLSLAFGWWGFPFGLVFTPIAIFQNLAGGKDVSPGTPGATFQPIQRGVFAPPASPMALPPATPVQVAWSDGRSYPATVLQARPDQVYVRFPDGREQWVPVQYVKPG